MKKNLVLVLGLIFLSCHFASCEAEDELNAMKTEDSPANPNIKNQRGSEEQTYDKEQIEIISCDEVESTTLYAGQDIDAGLIHISNSSEKLFVTYELTHTNWSLKETRLFIGREEEVPLAEDGNLIIGQFPFATQQDQTHRKEYTYAIPLEELDDCFVIIAHALIENDIKSSQLETAFGFDQDNEFPGSFGGWYLDYCLQECDDLDESGDEAGADQQGKEDRNNSSLSDEDCLESYAFHFADQSDAHCFLSSGFDQWGWTNQVFYSPQMNYVPGYVLEFPLLASAYQCDIRNSLEVGYVTVRISGTEGHFTADVEVVVTDSTYGLRAVDMYVGREKFPLNDASTATVLPEFYNYHESLTETRTFRMTDISWPANAHFIARGVLCPAN